ncbi:hypothetical protein EV359DRAFT_68881 [Lentinula novae-zelandiae]|nr:hypothetical protein EV359DRAFT_68881 [Lentinula novae-zelandiae]
MHSSGRFPTEWELNSNSVLNNPMNINERPPEAQIRYNGQAPLQRVFSTNSVKGEVQSWSTKYPLIEHKFDAIVISFDTAVQEAQVGHYSELFCEFKLEAYYGVTLGRNQCCTWVKGSDWLGDQDTVHYMCCKAPQTVLEVAETLWRTLLSYERSGQSLKYGKGGQAFRCAAAADRTGRAILHTLYGQALYQNMNFFIEYFTLNLIMLDGECVGVIAFSMEDDSHHDQDTRNGGGR